MQQGRGGMGSHKHGVSGVAGQNRRGLHALGRFINRLKDGLKKKPKEPMYDSMQDLMRKGKK
jgi:hypothetical protein